MNSLPIVGAIEAALGHAPPFADAELTALRGPVLVCGATSLDGLEQCTALEELTLFGCALASLDVVASLQRLRVLKILACDVPDLGALARADALEDVEINFCLAEVLTPLTRTPSLRRATLFGGSWQASGPDEAVRQLETAPRRHGRGALVRVDPDGPWALNQALRNRRLPLRYSEFGLGVVIVRAGVKHDGPGVDFVSTWPTHVQQALDAGDANDDAVAFLSRVAIPNIEQPETGPSRFIAQWEIGDQTDALTWIGVAKLSAEWGAQLTRFVSKIGDELRFMRETVNGLERQERAQEVRLPAWLKELRTQAPASTGPTYGMMTVRFDAYDYDPFEFGDRERWFEVGLVGYGDADSRQLIGERCRLYPIAFDDSARWQLAVATDDEREQRIFLYASRDLAAQGERAPIESRRFAVFQSYASMLAHVAAVRVGDRVIDAK